MAATKPALASGGITHCRLRCGLSAFFLESVRSCCRWPSRRCSIRRLFLRADAGSNGRTPPEPASTSERSVSPPRGVENSRPGGVGVVLALQRRLEPLLDQLLTRASDIVDAGVQRSRDGAVAPPFARLRNIGLQQDARSRQDLRRVL